MFSPDFPPLSTVRAAFTAHGALSKIRVYFRLEAVPPQACAPASSVPCLHSRRDKERLFLGKTILCRPKNGFPQTPFQESHTLIIISCILFLEKSYMRTSRSPRLAAAFMRSRFSTFRQSYHWMLVGVPSEPAFSFRRAACNCAWNFITTNLTFPVIAPVACHRTALSA